MTGAVLVVLELLGMFTFALSGALVAVRRDLDVFGIAVLAYITGLGGGIVRDVLIGVTPPTALHSWSAAAAPAAAALVVSVWHRRVGRRERHVLVADAFGLGLFCVSGTIVASEAGLGIWPASLMGLITSIGGGLLRDVLSGTVPAVLRSDLYASPAVVGALVASVTWHLDLPAVLYLVASAVCVTWRLLVIRYAWSAPRWW